MNTPSGKRKRDRGSSERNPRRRERPERLDRAEPDSSAMPTPDDTTYRILCSSIKIGTVIGRGGSIIKSLRRETNARIKVLDPIPGAEERVVLIWSTLQDEERKKYRDRREENENRNAKDGDGESRQKSKDSPFEPVCPAQDALFRVHAKIIENERNGGFNDNANNNDEDDEDEGERESDNPKSRSHQHHHNDGDEVIARLLVPNNQIGCLLGKGGRVIEKMRNETGAQIRITSKETLPTCALPTDELVQISGDAEVVRRALYEISSRIYESPLRDRLQGPGGGGMPPPAFPPRGGPMFPPVNPMYGGGGGYGGVDSWPSHNLPPYPPPGLTPIDRHDVGREEDFLMRILCRNDRIGMVIGKGGNAIRHLRDITGARIKVEDPVPDADERVISISATERLNDHSPVIEAVLKLLIKTNEGGERDSEEPLTCRLLVPSRQIGCLLGKRGSVITEMRKKTTAGLKVLQKVELPKCAQDSDELVQIVGDENVARQALLEVLSRLRCNAFGMELDDYLKSGGGLGPPPLPPPPPPPPPPFVGMGINDGFGGPPPAFGSRHDVGFSAAPPSSVMNRSDMSYHGGNMYPLNGYGFQGVPYESNFGIPPMPSLQGTGSGYGGYPDMEMNPYSSRLLGESGSFGDAPSRNPPNKIVEMIIPGASVSSVLGKGSSNVASIRQISGAKLTVLDPHPISGDRTVEIRGTPEQTQAAQSLLQAFIYSGQSSGGSGPRGML